MNPEIETWVARWQQGDAREDMFRRLFRHYARPLYSFFSNRGFTGEESRDLMQETFLAMLKGLPGYRQEHFDGWLFGIASNIWRNELRRRTSMKRTGQIVPLSTPAGELSVLETQIDDQVQPLDSLLTKERREALRSALDALPARMRQCVVLRVDRDLSHREIADILEIQVNTVKSQLFQAKAKLQRELGELFGDLEF